jgi:regulator of protease activity HflC (stomatin/prohibitin superfamily)
MFTYDLATDVGKFRAIFPDVVESAALFQDEQIAVFLELEGDIRRARARALEIAAADVVLTLRVTEVLGLRVDGAAAARELRLEAQAERERAAEAESRDEPMFDWAEWAIDPFSARDVLATEFLRSGS